MKYIFILYFLCLCTEGGLLAQNQPPPVFDKDFVADSATINSLMEDEDTTGDYRPRVSPYAAAQEKYNQETINQRDIDAEKWRKATAGIDYSDDKIEQQQPKKRSDNSGTMALAGLFLVFLKWFFILGGIGLLAFLIYRFIGEGNVFGTRSRKIVLNSEEIDLDKIEENLEKVELDPIIKKAIAAKNFPLAIRLYYLAILKELTLAGAIIWKKDKTNRIYVQEMQPHPLMEKFRQVTGMFERVWYGDTTLEETGFEEVRQPFENLLNDTRKK
jgi:hypothetical protein